MGVSETLPRSTIGSGERCLLGKGSGGKKKRWRCHCDGFGSHGFWGAAVEDLP